MISAELKYRNYVPTGWIAIEFSDLRFQGDREVVTCLNRLTDAIEFEKHRNNEIQIDQLSKQKEENLKKWIASRKELRDFKRKHILYFLNKNNREKAYELTENNDALAQEDDCLKLQIEKLESDSFFEAHVLTNKFKQLLAELGFTCKAVSCTEANKYLEIYESTCPDDELMARAQAMLTRIMEQQNKDNEDHCQ